MELAIQMRQIEMFMVVMVRIGAILFMAPIFSGKAIPAIAKASITLWLAFTFLPIAQSFSVPSSSDFWMFALVIIGEMLIGVSIAYLLQVITGAIQFGGHILGMHVGFRISNVFDPTNQNTGTFLGAFLNVVVGLLLLSLDYHLVVIDLVARSYVVIPPLMMNFHFGIFDLLVKAGSYYFEFAIRAVLPVFAVIFFVEVIVGVMARVVKGFNMLMLQFPIKIFVGLSFLGMLVAGFPEFVKMLFGRVLELVYALLSLLGPVNG